ncbi:hypothetical protein ACN28S_31155 [Cystobacter fuscus]
MGPCLQMELRQLQVGFRFAGLEPDGATQVLLGEPGLARLLQHARQHQPRLVVAGLELHRAPRLALRPLQLSQEQVLLTQAREQVGVGLVSGQRQPQLVRRALMPALQVQQLRPQGMRVAGG